MGNVGIEIDKIYFGIEQHRTRKESSKSVQIYIKYGDMQYKEKIRKFLLNFDTGEQITLDENDKLFRAKSKDGKVIEGIESLHSLREIMILYLANGKNYPGESEKCVYDFFVSLNEEAQNNRNFIQLMELGVISGIKSIIYFTCYGNPMTGEKNIDYMKRYLERRK